jgi:hypothetical protein
VGRDGLREGQVELGVQSVRSGSDLGIIEFDYPSERTLLGDSLIQVLHLCCRIGITEFNKVRWSGNCQYSEFRNRWLPRAT